MNSRKLSHQIIKILYETLYHYYVNRGVGKAGIILNYWSIWRDLHATFMNISDKGWKAIEKVANSLGLRLQNTDQRWLFVFAMETYMTVSYTHLTLPTN